MEYPKGYWPLLQYIRKETDEILKSDTVTKFDLSIWSQEVGEGIFSFYLANKDHSRIDSVYKGILEIFNSDHKKIKKKINNPRIRETSLDEFLKEGEIESLAGVE